MGMKSIARPTVLLLCAALAACARQSLPSLGLSPSAQAAAIALKGGSAYRVVYTFKGGTDGNSPTGDLIAVRGALYGTTASGGTSTNLGTVFSVTPSGSEHVVFRFAGGPNASTPISGLTLVHGRLYGVTTAQLFVLAPSGASYSALGIFSSDSAQGPLASTGGRLYGVTRFGGLDGKGCTDKCGSVFAASPSGAVQTLYNFHGGGDGGEPGGGLIAVKGDLYGTTLYGGTHNAGTIFKITTTGAHQVLHSFNPKSDGAQPRGKLYESGGVLYGTTEYEGKNDGGTLFSVTPAGRFAVMYQFGASGDAANPTGSLTEMKGIFYGTSSFGGTYNSGAVFALNRAGSERVVYSFSETPSVVPGLLAVKGALYGATAVGGKQHAGTIFEIKP